MSRRVAVLHDWGDDNEIRRARRLDDDDDIMLRGRHGLDDRDRTEVRRDLWDDEYDIGIRRHRGWDDVHDDDDIMIRRNRTWDDNHLDEMIEDLSSKRRQRLAERVERTISGRRHDAGDDRGFLVDERGRSVIFDRTRDSRRPSRVFDLDDWGYNSTEEAPGRLVRRHSDPTRRPSNGYWTASTMNAQRHPNVAVHPESAYVSKSKQRADGLLDLSDTTHDKIDAVYHIQSQRNMSISLEIDIEEDIETRLNHLRNLKRLGHFSKADQFFQQYLAHSFHLLPVAAEYSSLLLEQGSYQRLLKLDFEEITSLFWTRSGIDLQRTNGDEIHLLLILRIALMPGSPSEYASLRIPEKALRFLELRSEAGFGPTEVQILCLCIRLFSSLVGERNLPFTLSPGGNVARLESIRNLSIWNNLFHDLLHENRLWELYDVFSALISSWGPSQACHKLLGEPKIPLAVDMLVDEWKGIPHDNDSWLPLLGILTELCRYPCHMIQQKEEDFIIAQQISEITRNVAASVQRSNPESIKSRIYLRWILMMEGFVRIYKAIRSENASKTSGLTPKYFLNYPGRVFWTSTLPIYIPQKSENPGWPVVYGYQPPNSNHLETATRAAQELGDYRIQEACLKELICRSAEPKQLFADLERLQRKTMGNNLGLLETALSKYLISQTKSSQEELRLQLAELDPLNNFWRDGFRNLFFEMAHHRVLYALLSSLEYDLDQYQEVDGYFTHVNPSNPPISW